MVPLMRTLSNAIYLIYVWALFAIIFRRYPRIAHGNDRRQAFWVGAAVLGLACGDSFHLIPRLYVDLAELSGRAVDAPLWLGAGLAISSFTVSLFYFCLLFYALNKFELPRSRGVWMLVAAFALRVLLLFFPQNNWFTSEPTAWKLYRNIPFVVQGLGVVVLLLQYAGQLPQPEGRLLRYTAYAVVVSFVCYAVTVIGTYWHPAWGAAMLPKTWAYMFAVWWLYKTEFPAVVYEPKSVVAS